MEFHLQVDERVNFGRLGQNPGPENLPQIPDTSDDEEDEGTGHGRGGKAVELSSAQQDPSTCFKFHTNTSYKIPELLKSHEFNESSVAVYACLKNLRRCWISIRSV